MNGVHRNAQRESEVKLLTVRQVATMPQQYVSCVREMQARLQPPNIKVAGAVRFGKREYCRVSQESESSRDALVLRRFRHTQTRPLGGFVYDRIRAVPLVVFFGSIRSVHRNVRS